MIDESKKLLDLLGIPWVEAPGEGEAQVASLLNQGMVDYGASQDFDTVLFGASKFVRNLTLSGRRKLPKQQKWVDVSPEIIDLERSEIVFRSIITAIFSSILNCISPISNVSIRTWDLYSFV